MGNRDLAGFRAQLTQVLGGRVFADALLDSWFHDGYYDLTGAVDFQEFRTNASIGMAAGDRNVALPLDYQWARALYDVTHDRPLIETGPDQFVRFDEDDEGEPSHWIRMTGGVWVYPKLSVDVTVRILYQAHPSALVSDTDKSALTPTWDKAIELLMKHHALFDVGEEVRAQDFLGRAMSYIRSRIHEDEYEFMGPSEGLGVARSVEDLRSGGIWS
jgi:hypothetical protein